MSEKRKDNKGRILRNGEIQERNGTDDTDLSISMRSGIPSISDLGGLMYMIRCLRERKWSLR